MKSLFASNHIFALLCLLASLLTACQSSRTPKQKIAKNLDDGCAILHTDSSWAKAFDDTFRIYGVPPHVVMAIMHQESRFIHNARPPERVEYGVSMGRPSTAFGYAQALDQTWDWYQNKTGKKNAKRDHFPDAADFIGWYIGQNYLRTGVSKWDAKNQYLAYHEGTGGFLRKSHYDKPWLLQVSDKVDARSKMYRQQLSRCYKYPPFQ